MKKQTNEGEKDHVQAMHGHRKPIEEARGGNRGNPNARGNRPGFRFVGLISKPDARSYYDALA